jgi:hypothetical protein
MKKISKPGMARPSLAGRGNARRSMARHRSARLGEARLGGAKQGKAKQTIGAAMEAAVVNILKNRATIADAVAVLRRRSALATFSSLLVNLAAAECTLTGLQRSVCNLRSSVEEEVRLLTGILSANKRGRKS